MATTGLHPSPIHTPNGSSSPNPPTPPTLFHQFPGLQHATSSSSTPSIQRNASTSSSHSTTTTSSTSSLMAVPMRAPPLETRTATTTPIQPSGDDSPAGSRAGSGSESKRPDRIYHSPQPTYGGRGFMRNGPRSGGMARQSTSPVPPIQTSSPEYGQLALASSPLKGKSTTLPIPQQLSPTTPRAQQAPWSTQGQVDEPEVRSPEDPPMVYVTESGPSSPSSPRGRAGLRSVPASPNPAMGKPRTLSVDVRTDFAVERERRMSQASTGSNSGTRKPSARDWIFGEEIGRGSYSTVVQARPANLTTSNIRHDREYAVKIMNQMHLIAEKKAKYAVIERDALIRLAQPRASTVSPTSATRHKRGQSGSSARRRSNASASGSAEKPAAKDRLSIAISDTSTISSPLSPTLLAGRRPSRSAEPPAMVIEGAEGHPEAIPRSPVISRSKPPSPVKEESSSQGHGDEDHVNDSAPAPTPAPAGRASTERATSVHHEKVSPASLKFPADAQAVKSTLTPKKRRKSQAPSERSVKTVSGNSKSTGQAHPGIIRLYSTFNDNMSLYYVLELASNGELLHLIRQYGSFDVDSARYYAAQLVDTIEFMHERDVIHRDLKPENILLDSEWRIKVTDFGSAKILGRDKDPDQGETRKRSFVGSADFVSPEVLRNEPAVLSSDIWALGCIIFQLLTGKPPFRGATDYLTFQKILKREIEYPADFDPDAKALIDLILNLDPSERPSPSDIKAHSFFATCDFSTLWTCPAPTITSGLTKPLEALKHDTSSSDIWAVFDDDVSEGGFEYDDLHDHSPDPTAGPTYDRTAASDAVRNADSVDPQEFAQPRYAFQDAGSEGDSILQPPRPSFVDASPKGKWGRGRLGSHGSERTSSSSSTNRNALSGLLESLKLQGSPFSPGSASKGGSSRNSRTSERSAEVNMMGSFYSDQSGRVQTPVNNSSSSTHAAGARSSDQGAEWSSLLLANEKILHTTTILVRAPTSIHLPSFLLPSPKRRQLLLTDFPRLITVKEEVPGSSGSGSSMSVKSECVFLAKGSARRGAGGDTKSRVEEGSAGWVLDVQEKGPKGFTVQTTTQILNYMTDSADIQKGWMTVLKRFLE